jgi:hypothetical protein
MSELPSFAKLGKLPSGSPLGNCILRKQNAHVLRDLRPNSYAGEKSALQAKNWLLAGHTVHFLGNSDYVYILLATLFCHASEHAKCASRA